MGIDFDFHDRVVVVHAVFASIAVLGTAPAAALCGRYMRRSRWFVWHRALNTATFLLVVLAFALGVAAVNSQGQGTQFTGANQDLHHDLGLALFILIGVQGVFGFVASFTKKHGTSSRGSFHGKSIVRWCHAVAGVVMIGLMYTEAWTGFDEWNTMQNTGTFAPDAVRYIFLVVMGVEITAYLYDVGCATLLAIPGDDGRGSWRKLIQDEEVVPSAPAPCGC